MKRALLFLIALSLFPAPALARRSAASKLAKKASRKIEEELADSLVQPPRDLEVCFTPGERCEAKLVKFVRSAKKSLDIAIYDINLDQLVHEVLKAARELPVRVVVDRKQAKTEKSLVKTLLQGGVQVRYGKQRGIMHNKFIIVDGAMVETGSFNYTHGAAHMNNENQIYLASPDVVARYRMRFDSIWEDAFRTTGRGAGKED